MKIFRRLLKRKPILVLITVMILSSCSGKQSEINKNTVGKSDTNVTNLTPVPTQEPTSTPNQIQFENIDEDSYNAINNLVNQFYEAQKYCDLKEIDKLTNFTFNKSEEYLKKLTEGIDAYIINKNYVLKAEDENSFVVFTEYKVKFNKAQTPASSLSSHYVFENEKGEWILYVGDIMDSLNRYVLQVSKKDEVQKLILKTEDAFQKELSEDTDLKKIKDDLKNDK